MLDNHFLGLIKIDIVFHHNDRTFEDQASHTDSARQWPLVKQGHITDNQPWGQYTRKSDYFPVKDPKCWGPHEEDGQYQIYVELSTCFLCKKNVTEK